MSVQAIHCFPNMRAINRSCGGVSIAGALKVRSGTEMTAEAGAVDEALAMACSQVVADVNGLQRYTQEDMPVESGSPIYTDDGLLDAFSMRELIDAPLRAAIDDLVLAAVSLNHWKAVRGYAHPTLVRSAITGAATALWIMDPDVATRRLHALRMSYQISKSELSFVRGVPVNWNGDGVGPTLEEKQARVQSREEKLQRVVENGLQLGFTAQQIKDKPTDSMMVQESAKRLPPGSFHCAADEHLLTEWRLLSGRAHGLIWPVHYTNAAVKRSSDKRFITAPIAMPLDRMLGSVQSALTLINCAVDHYSDLIKAPR